MPSISNVRRGALYMLISALLFAIMGALIKIVSRYLPNEMVVFFRSLAGLLVLLPWLVHHGFKGLATNHLSAHLARSLAGLTAMYCFFYALSVLPLAEATLLNYATPLFTPFIAYVWLREHVNRRVKVAIAVGFAGILFILKPGGGLFTGAALVGLSAGVFAALAMVSIRKLTRTEPTWRIVFYFSLVSTIVSSFPLLYAWKTPDPSLWGLLLAMGAVASLAQVFLTRAYAQAPAAQVGPFTYATVLFAAGAGWWFWGEAVDALTLLGAVLVVVGGIAALRTQHSKTVVPV
jgi:drug/metabolite transporter (DMT)-like permease